MIDLHSHILPGLDDGTTSLDEACQLATDAVEDGITIIAATPHVRPDYPTTPEQMISGVDALRTALTTHNIPLQVVPGGEIAFEMVATLSDDELARFTLGASGTYLLLETPYMGWPPGIDTFMFDLRLRGFRILLAHPERNPEIQARPDLLRPLIDAGVLVQLTAASIDGRVGGRAQTTARRLIAAEAAHVIASDAHAPSVRQIGMRAARDLVGSPALGHWLTSEVPHALLADIPLPPRPVSRAITRPSWRTRFRRS